MESKEINQNTAAKHLKRYELELNANHIGPFGIPKSLQPIIMQSPIFFTDKLNTHITFLDRWFESEVDPNLP